LEQNLVIGTVRNGAAGGERGEGGAAAAAQHSIDRIVMDERAAPAAPRGVALRQHGEDRGKVFAGKLAIGRGAAQQSEKLILAPVARRDFGDDLLGQHVERLLGDRYSVELAATNAVEERGAFDELV